MTKETDKKTSKTATKKSERKSEKAAKGPSKVQKRAAKVLKKSTKAASKIKVRGGQEKKSRHTGTETRKKFKAVGHAPQSARISAHKGEMRRAVGTTPFAPGVNSERSWLIVDAAGQAVGRLASEIANFTARKAQS